MHRLGIVGGVLDGLGQQLDRADGGLQLVADVGDEVASYGFDPALPGAVLDQSEDQAGTQRRHPGADVPRGPRLTVDDELGLADLAVAAYLLDQRAELLGDQAGAADEAHRERRRGRLDHDLVVVDDHRAAPQHREHGRDARRHQRLLHPGLSVLLAVREVPGEHRAARNEGTEKPGEERLSRRIHD